MTYPAFTYTTTNPTGATCALNHEAVEVGTALSTAGALTFDNSARTITVHSTD